MLHYVSGSRFPIVMMNANRTVAAPWNIYGDHRDSMSMRDSGWMQVYVEDGQEALDSVIQAYKVAENHEVSTPIMVCVDGFVLTHTYELVNVPKQELVDQFLPTYVPTDNVLDLKYPRGLCISVSHWPQSARESGIGNRLTIKGAHYNITPKRITRPVSATSPTFI